MPKIFDHHKKAPRSVLIAVLAAFSALAGAASAESSSPANAAAIEVGNGSADVTTAPGSMTIAPPQAAVKASQPAVSASYGNLPIAFELNQGQTDARVKFFARGQGYGLYLNAAEAVLDLHRGADGSALSPQKAKARAGAAMAGAPEAQGESTHAAVRMSLRDANAAAPATGLDPQPGVSNYLIGNDPKKWHTKIQHYGKVRYAGVYPGVDLVFYGNQQQLEYDFIVAPGADPAAIKLDFDGVDKLSIDAEGNLVLATTGGKVVQHKPVIYQTIEGQRKQIDGGYVVRGNQAAFQIAAYDKSQALTIDPTLAYSTYFGDAGPNSAYAIAVDASGAMYLAGTTSSLVYPTTTGAYEPKPNLGTTNPASDGFVTKINADGKSVGYSTYLGGSGSDAIFRIAVDEQGHAYVAGGTGSADFPTISGGVQRNFGGAGENSITTLSGDAFVSELAVDGESLKFSTFLGGSGDDLAFGLALDSSGNVYVAGETTSSDFITTPGAYQPLPVNKLTTSSASPTSATNAFVVKLSPDASQRLYSTFIGVDAKQGAYNLAVDAAGNAYIVGFTTSVHFPTTTGVFQPAAGHPDGSIYSNGFVFKLNPTGSARVYSTYLGNYSEAINSIALDAGGNAYVAGWSQSPNFPTTPGAYQTTHPEWTVETSAFVTKINAAATALIYSTYVHGMGNASDSFYAGSGGGGTVGNPAGSNIVSVDINGNAYLVGSIGGSCCDPKLSVTPDAYQSKYGGSDDAFVAELNPAGSQLIYATYLGGSGWDDPFGAVLTPNGKLYIAGATGSTDFPTVNAYQSKSPGTVTNYGSWNFVSQLVFPVATGYAVGGTVSGLAGSGLVLSLNGSQTLALNADGSFAFPTALADGSPYTVTVSSQPTASPAQTCTASHGSGSIAEANVTNIAVTCAAIASNYTVGGTVIGLAGSGLVLSLNNGVQTLPVSANGSFTFPTALANGSAYAVSVATQPGAPAQSCSISNGSGTVAGANVTNVSVVCSTNSPSYIVTPSTGANGSISPAAAQTVASGTTATFTVTPNNGYRASVGGSCGGNLTGVTYTTNAVTADCSVIASFAPIALVSTTTTLTATPNPVQVGQPLTLIATVTTNAVTNGLVKRAVAAGAAAAAAPTGTVTFKNGSSTVGAAQLAGGGMATLTIPNLTPGTYSFTVLYSGDANDSASASAVPLSVTVNASSSAPTIPAPATSAWGWIVMCLGLAGIGGLRRRRA